jgi:hypothetical protein
MSPFHLQETDMNATSWSLAAATLLALGLGGCTTPSTGDAATKRTPGYVGCFDPARVRSFATADDGALLIDAGTSHYRLELDPTCHPTDFDVALRFRGNPISGRVCGSMQDAVIGRHGACSIHRVEWITPEQHKALLEPEPRPEDATPAK